MTATALVAERIREGRPPVAGREAARDAVVLGSVTVLLFALPYVAGVHVQQVGYRVLQYAALATAWNLLAGYTGMISLGSAAFVGLGAYTVAELDVHTGLPVVLALPLGGLAAAAFAVVVSPALFRLRGLSFTIGTLALAEALRLWMINDTTLGGTSGIFLQSRALKAYQLYWIALAVAALGTGLVMIVLRTRLALRLAGIRDDEDVARQLGVRTFRAKLWAFAVSAFVIGLVGGVQALRLGVVEPYGSFGLSWTIDTVTVAIIGGLGTRTGPWVGALFAVLLGELLQDRPEIHLAVTGMVMLVLIRFAPRGLWGWVIAFPAGRPRAGRSAGRLDGREASGG